MDPQTPDKNSAPASYAEFAQEGGGILKTIVQFIAIPLLIVGVAVGGFLGISSLVDSGPRSAMDFVTLLRSDTVNRRRQAAMELANRLAGEKNPEEFHDPRLVAALCSALKVEREEPRDPPDTARLILLMFMRMKDPATLDAARAAALDSNPWIRSYALPVLGALRDQDSSELLLKLSNDEDHGTRQAALVALAGLDQEQAGEGFHLSERTREVAIRHLGDRHEDVRFEAAIVLAWAGDAEHSLPLLRKMLDRTHLKTFDFDTSGSGIDRHRVQSNLMIKAIDALLRLPGAGDPEAMDALRRLADDGEDFVRQRAREALQQLSTRT